MVTIKNLVLLCMISALFALPADAKTATQTANVPSKPKKQYSVSTTTGWRKIDGWQKSVIERDPNLKNWAWMGMREMEKDYTRLRPGQVGTVRPRRYKTPQHISTPQVTRVTHYMSAPPVPTKYVKPANVPLPKRQTVATSAQVRLPSRDEVATSARLRLPTRDEVATSVRLAAPSTNVRLAAPATQARLAAPETHAQLASKNTSINLTAPKKMPTDAMSDCGGGPTVDNFESPDEIVNPYGPSRQRNFGYSSKANVRAKVIKRH
jgi:hypothetical protein